MRPVAWTLQILILAAGIYLFLRFVRTTRGNRLIRGLFLSVVVGVVGLWGLSRALRLEELEHLLRSSTGFIVVGFVVIFQSELRRGIAQLGEHSFLGRLMHPSGGEAVSAVMQAARSLAQRRQGALIVFERDTPLSPYLETGTHVDAEVRASLLESLFHPETPLHDGAVVLRKGRIAAAGCILPLSEEALPPPMGTRHRAGLGLSEESDAVVLIVSEETGSISLAKGGTLSPDLPPDDLERALGRILQGRNHDPSEPGGTLAIALGALKRDLIWLPGPLLLALGIFYIAHQGLQETQEFQVHFVDGRSQGHDRGPRAQEILVQLAGDHDRLMNAGQDYWVQVTGTRRELEELGGAVCGVLRIEQEGWEGGPVSCEDVRWEDPVGGLEYAWKGGTAPELIALRFESKTCRLLPEHVEIDASKMNPRFRLLKEELRFEPSASVEISGPVEELNKLPEPGAEPGDFDRSLALRLEPISLTSDEDEELRRRVNLHPDLRSRRLTLIGEVVAVVPIAPVAREIGTVTKEIALVCLDPGRSGELQGWSLPPQARSASFAVQTLGLIPHDADPASPAMIERFGMIRRFVEENLRVFVDVAELPPAGEGRSASVRWTWRRSWRESAQSLGFKGPLGSREGLDVVLESDAEILLEPRPPASATSSRSPTEDS